MSRDASETPAQTAPMANSRAVAATQTRERLISTGLRLAERTGLAGLSVNLLVEEAGVSKGTFFHHFKDRATYLLAMHRSFFDGVLDEMFTAIDGMQPGYSRLLAGIETYLDACLRHRGVRALLLEARGEPLIADAVRERHAQIAGICVADLRVMDWPLPIESASLCTGLVAEAAIIELETGGRNRTIRALIRNFLQRDNA